MEITNKKGEVLAIADGGKLKPVEGKETEVLDNLYDDYLGLQKRVSELESNARVFAVIEKSIRSGLVK